MMEKTSGPMVALLAALLLAGCGSGTAELPVRQFGVAEPQLKQTGNASGITPGSGSGLVTSQIEPAGGQPAPLVGDTANVGVDELFFEVDQTSTISINTGGEGVPAVSRVTVLDAGGVVRFTAAGDSPQALVKLERGTYVLRLTATTGASEIALGMAWFGGQSGLTVVTDLQKLASGNCPRCSLQGANLSGTGLRGFNLAGADLRNAIMVQVPGGLKLSGTDMMTVLLNGSDIAGADLSGANLVGARLSGAYLTGAGQSAANLSGADLASAQATDLFLPRADLHGANLANADLSRSVLTRALLRGANMINAIMVGTDLSGADLGGALLDGANFTGARLAGTIWSDRRVCAANSVGVCL
ncbi:MAG: pentapeptide repeat-containing protein [Rhodoferax sp.]